MQVLHRRNGRKTENEGANGWSELSCQVNVIVTCYI